MGTKGSKLLEAKQEADVEVHKLHNVETGNDSSKDNSIAVTPDKLSEALLLSKMFSIARRNLVTKGNKI